jgi:hypothetical protein
VEALFVLDDASFAFDLDEQMALLDQAGCLRGRTAWCFLTEQSFV